MKLEELKEKMIEINKTYKWDEETCHVRLDDLLLEYINDAKVTELFHAVDKWYA